MATTTYGIKLPQEAPSAKAISAVRKATELSMADIRACAIEGRFIFECDCSDDEGLRIIIGLHRSLKDLGVAAELFWHGAPETIDVLENILAAHEDTAKELGLLED